MIGNIPLPAQVFENPQAFEDFILNPKLEEQAGQWYDFKEVINPLTGNQEENLKKSLKEGVSGFANSNKEGGLLILGVSNDGTLSGANHLDEKQENRLTALPNQVLKYHSTQVRTHSIGGNKILLFYIPFEPNNICQTTEGVPHAWKRVGPQCLPFTRDDWDYFRLRKGQLNWELQPCEKYDFKLLDKGLFEEFKIEWLSKSEIPSQFSDEDILRNAGAITQHEDQIYFTNAGYLFFCQFPQRFFPSAYVRFFKFDANLADKPNPGSSIFEKEFKESLPNTIRKIRDWIKDSGFFGSYTYRNPEGFNFTREDEYPIIAIGEAIVNAIVHREYGQNLTIDCIYYKDAFVVKNPGGIQQSGHSLPMVLGADGKPKVSFKLDGGVALSSERRNQTIMELMKGLPSEDGRPFVLSRSEGTRRIKDEMEKAGLPPVVYESNGYTSITFQNNLEERRKKFELSSNPEKSKSEYINFFKITFSGSTNGHELNILKKDLLKVIRDALVNQGWFIDRYRIGRLVMHKKGNYITTGNFEADKIVGFYSASIFNIRIIDGEFYLVIDYKLEVKNILRLSELPKDVASKLEGRQCLFQFEGQWIQGTINEFFDEGVEVFSEEVQVLQMMNAQGIIPSLHYNEIKQVLKLRGISIDLDLRKKQASLSTTSNSVLDRYQRTLETASMVAGLGPLKYNGFTIQVKPDAEYLFEPPKVYSNFQEAKDLTVFHDLPEPMVVFGDHHKDTNILTGLSKYGAFSRAQKEVEIVPVCTDAEKEMMEELISRLVHGKIKFEGTERTFGIKLNYTAVQTVQNHHEIESACKKLVNKNPAWVGNQALDRIFLVSTPEHLFSTDDTSSPYYSIKEFLFERGIPCQMVDTPTLRSPDFRDMNLALNISAKCGVVPWMLAEALPDADFFLGIAYTTISGTRNKEKLMGFVSVFDQYGRWKFYKGDAVFDFQKRSEYFGKLIPETLSELGISPSGKIHIHSASRFSKDDIRSILNACKAVCPEGIVTFTWINDSHNMRAYDNSNPSGSLNRGAYVKLSKHEVLLSTTGHNTLRKTIGTPRMLDLLFRVEPKEVEVDSKLYAKQVLALTKLNWASTQALCGEPITTKYASGIAYITEKFIRRSGQFKLHPVLEKTPWFI